MRLGLLADIHGHADLLRIAIQKLRNAEVDQFIVLGDVIYDSRNASETVALLEDCQAVGVWGNHDLGLCLEPEKWANSQFPQPVLNYCGTLGPRYEHGDLLFSHTFPSQDPADPVAYYLGPHPDEMTAFDECFARFPHRVFFIGHFHRWLLATPEGLLEWDGQHPIEFDAASRYFVIVDTVMNGSAAIFDNATNILTPIQF